MLEQQQSANHHNSSQDDIIADDREARLRSKEAEANSYCQNNDADHNPEEIDDPPPPPSPADEPNLMDEPVDPRVQIELENLNTLTDLINKLELELDDSRAQYRQLLSDSSDRINQLAKKLGGCVEKSKIYYEARIRTKQLQNKTQSDAVRYERATSSHLAAKEMVCLSEEGLSVEGRLFDPAWQEMLNHATMKVNDAERERVISEREHLKSSKAYMSAEREVSLLHKQLKRSITKARPYYEAKAEFNQRLEDQKQEVRRMEINVTKAKRDYASALRRLESISYEIHERRNLERTGSIASSTRSSIRSRPDHDIALHEPRIPAIGAEQRHTGDLIDEVQHKHQYSTPIKATTTNSKDTSLPPPSTPSAFGNGFKRLSISSLTSSTGSKRPQSNTAPSTPGGNHSIVASPRTPGTNSLVSWFYKSASRDHLDSDRESVTSADTMDTLDDAMIEKLMLEPTLDSEYRDIHLNDP